MWAFVSLNNPCLAATPDGSVYDPTDPHIQGILEIKNTYNARDETRAEASATSGVCLEKRDDTYKLKEDMTIIAKSSASSTVQTEIL